MQGRSCIPHSRLDVLSLSHCPLCHNFRAHAGFGSGLVKLWDQRICRYPRLLCPRSIVYAIFANIEVPFPHRVVHRIMIFAPTETSMPFSIFHPYQCNSAYLSLRASRSDSRRQRMSFSRTGPLTFRMMDWTERKSACFSFLQGQLGDSLG